MNPLSVYCRASTVSYAAASTGQSQFHTKHDQVPIIDSIPIVADLLDQISLSQLPSLQPLEVVGTVLTLPVEDVLTLPVGDGQISRWADWRASEDEN